MEERVWERDKSVLSPLLAILNDNCVGVEKMMSFLKSFAGVANLSPDARVGIFRSFFSAPGEFDNLRVDAYVVVTERCVVFCDTLLCPEDMRLVCEMLGDDVMKGKQVLVVYSHADWDHVWGAHYLVERYNPVIIGHEHCRTRLLSVEEMKVLHEYQEKFDVFRPVSLVPPEITFRGGLNIYGGDLTLELFSAPGHQRDQIAGWIPELRLLLAFDALEYPLPGIGAPELVPDMFRTLERFRELQPEYVLCSHGNMTSPLLIEQNLSYLYEIEKRSRALLTRRLVSEDEMADPAQLIGYAYAEAIGVVREQQIDHAYCEYTHAENIRCVLRWLLSIA
jgi:glyoxylase-like metal-dependent hydrolase (beta-lactamase superfamily II)